MFKALRNPVADSIIGTSSGTFPYFERSEWAAITCSGDSIFGSKMKSGLDTHSASAFKSSNPKLVKELLTRIASNGLVLRGVPIARKARTFSRAAYFWANETESSRSTINTSAPTADAFSKRSGRVAGVNSQLRLRAETIEMGDAFSVDMMC